MARGHGDKLSRKQEQAVAALLDKPSIKGAAEACGVNEKTLRQWLLLPAFQAEYRSARRQVVEHAVGRLQRSAARAAATLRRNLVATRAADQIRAALGILGHATEAVELMDLVERLDALEARMGQGAQR